MIRGGTCVLPWGEAAADIGVRDGRIAAIGVPGERRCRRRSSTPPGCTCCPA